MYSTVEIYDMGGVKWTDEGGVTESLESLYWPNFKWANHQCYSNVRPVWGGTEGTDYRGVGQALSSDGQMDAGDWLGGGKSKP